MAKGKSKKKEASGVSTPPKSAKEGVVIPKQTLQKIIPLKNDLRIEDLDENILKERLELLNKELNYYKGKCKSLKSENEKLRDEIEENKKDTSEYIKYLEESKDKKQQEIDKIIEKANEEFQFYLNKKLERKNEYDKKYEGRLTKSINQTKQEHDFEISNLERELLQNRVKIQRETEQTIKNMEAIAQEKASKYLNEYINLLDKDNSRLEVGLALAIKTTDKLMEEKDRLERENEYLRQENIYRDSLANIRLKRINKAIEKKKKNDIQHDADENLHKREKLLKLLARNNEITPELIDFVNKKLKWEDDEYL
ncbi:hypothetical protein H8356DRAFT_1288802 [Neocallimastix lanati (nom. inval.)]|nr:hypothetical protein H8356DRAFT_1288802 [Neocallimastix sp. JGI-2020a]